MKTHTAGEWTEFTNRELFEVSKDVYDTATLKHFISKLHEATPITAAQAVLWVASYLPDPAERHFRNAVTAEKQTTLSPRQLQAINAELVEALEEMVNTFTAGESGMHLIRLHAIETLARAKSNP